MSLEYAVGFALSVLITGYLLVALIRAEKF